MTVELTPSEVFAETYHARVGDEPVGMVRLNEDLRWDAFVYRPGTDLRASFSTRAEAEAFVRDNAQREA